MWTTVQSQDTDVTQTIGAARAEQPVNTFKQSSDSNAAYLHTTVFPKASRMRRDDDDAAAGTINSHEDMNVTIARQCASYTAIPSGTVAWMGSNRIVRVFEECLSFSHFSRS